MVLTKAQRGDRHKIASIQANASVSGKLAALGLIPGSEIDILQCSLHGAAIVSCKGAQFALGRGLADLIYLEN
ncbi:MAG: FeoA family protein [Planctomycetia bacterium]|nr:FeoA family protein [Planctomycetia bacterium]